MPTTKSKNILYRLSLPFLSPSIPSDPVFASAGIPLHRERMINGIIRKNHVSGGAITLKSGEKYASVFTKPIHTDVMPDNNTYYRVASITKMATSLVSVILMDQGILDPDKPVSDILPDCRGIPELNGILTGNLLSHTSGIIDPPGLEKMLLDHVPLKDVLSACRKDSKKGQFRYSNLGFGIVGCMFESLLNLPVEQVFQKYLFKPAKLDATLSGATLNQGSIMPVKRILPWRDDKSMTVTPLGMKPIDEPEPSFHFGFTAGSMYITLPSMIKLIEYVRDGGKPFVSDSYSGYMKEEKAKYGHVSPTLSYGHGLLRINDKNLSDSFIFGHQGFAYGCVDGAFWEDSTGDVLVSLNGSCSEARIGRLGIVNRDLCRFTFREEIPLWK